MKFMKLLLSLMLISAISFALMFAILGGFSETQYTDTVEIEVQLGDTLWTIAEKYMPEMDVREAVHELKLLNPTIHENYLAADSKITIPLNTNFDTDSMQALN